MPRALKDWQWTLIILKLQFSLHQSVMVVTTVLDPPPSNKKALRTQSNVQRSLLMQQLSRRLQFSMLILKLQFSLHQSVMVVTTFLDLLLQVKTRTIFSYKNRSQNS